MIISHKLKYVYVAIPKTGSSSITTKLRDSNEFEYSIMGYHQKFMEEQYFYQYKMSGFLRKHYILKTIQWYFDAMGWNWDEYFKFSFVRNPFDRFVSSYKEKLKYNRTMLSFKEFSEKAWYYQSCYSYLEDINGNIGVDFVGRFENLQEDFAKIVSIILPNHKKKSTFLEHLYETPQEYMNIDCKFNNKALSIAKKKFSKDLIWYPNLFNGGCYG
tara:strand:- start:975 stop:1619 length:645 start_codon:yes stop_codon:yes gene_type:complete